MKNLINKLEKIYDEKHILINESMKKHSSFKIGGIADILVIPQNEKEILETIKLCKEEEINYFIIGNGSNILVSDKGIRGVVVKIGPEFSDYLMDGEFIEVKSGILLSNLSGLATKNSLTGLEFASGIPGTLGGGITMNAGAYGGEMKQIVESVKFLTNSGEILNYSREELKFGYRTSVFSNSESVILSAKLKLKKGNREVIEKEIKDFTVRRTSKQPLDMPSSGSTFKRPIGNFAGKLIDECGLKGLRHGDAMVSEKHCGFVVNVGEATSKEVLELIKTIQKIVFDNCGVKLETEVKFIGED